MKERKIKNKQHPLGVFNAHTDLILKNIDEVIYYVTIDKKGKKEIVFLSDKIFEILGITKKKYFSLGKKIIEYCHKDDVPAIISNIKALLKKKIKGSFRYRFYHAQKKKYLWIEETIYPQVDSKKKLIGYFGVSRNIENEKKAEEQITESEKKFRLLAENSSDIIFHFQFKPTPSYTYVSPSAKRILGYSPEEFYKDALIGFKIIHPADRDLLLNSQQNVIKRKAIRQTFAKLSARYITKSGGIVWLENRYSPIYKGKEITALHCVSRDITEQKLKEEELDNNKTQLSNILSNLPGMAYRCLNDNKWTMKFISSGSIELTGYKPEEFIDNKKRSFASIIHPEDRGLGKKEIREALRNRKSFQIEYRIIDKKGNTKWIWEKGSGVYNQKNKLLYIEGFINDISERKIAEQELNQRWLNYRNLIDSIPVGIFIHVDGKIQFGNKEAYAIAEITNKDDLDSFSLVDFLLPEDRPLGIERIKRAMAGEDTPFVEYNVITHKGSKKVIRTKSSLIFYNSAKAIQIVVQDITLEKKLEDEKIRARFTEQTNKELHKEINLRIESEQKLKAIFESTSHLIWSINRNLELVSYNKQYYEAVKKLCGVTLKPGIKITEFKGAFSKEDYKTLREAHKAAFKGKDTKIEIPLKAIDGKIYYREMHFHPIIIDGKISEIAAVAQDTTERRNYEKQITEQTAKLKAIFESGSQRIWTVDRKFNLTSFNKNFSQAYQKSLGKKPELNSFVLELVKNTPYYHFWKEKYRAVLTGESLEFETNHIVRYGKPIYGQVFLHPIYNEQKQVVEIAALSQDITDRKNAEQQITEQSARLRAIFKSGSQLMWTINKKLQLTSFNKNYANAIYELYGTYPELDIAINRLPDKMRSEEYNEFWNGKYEEVLKGKSVEFDTERNTLTGKKIYRHIFLHPIYNEKNEVIEVSAVGYDITGQKKAQEEILSKQAQLAAIINTTNDIIFSIDHNYKLVEFNNVFKKIIKQRSDREIKQGELLFDFLPPRDQPALKAVYKRVLSGESVTDIETFDVAGEQRLYEAHYNPIKTDKKITGIAVFSRDITEQKQNEEEVLNKQSRLSAIINNTQDVILSIDKNHNLIEFNEALRKIVKHAFNKDLKPGMPVFETMAPQYHAQTKEIYTRVFNGENASSVERYGSGENEIFLETHYNPIKTAGKITGIAIFSRDISAQKKSEDDILKSLKEKEILLKEVHHRVKNNLQVISSILNLQTAYLKDRGTINLLKECQNRIKTMAFIHESLYQNKDFSQINFSEYIITLVKNLFYSFEANQQKIRTNFAVDTIFLNLDLSIPCGLIINELVSNALKYAFDDGREGTVFITLKKEKEKIKITVSDNGRGMPENVNFRNTETLGLQLVTTLTEQINGTITMIRNKGTTFEIIF
ncbi:MAG TPA: PAS domain S-box protein [Bacteroidia bacterium]|jgi:PAS domain S-box-containing protein|nr:PAS domain S-box protein [Bacteroidia bacterium]